MMEKKKGYNANYRQKIVKMVEEIENPADLEMLYGMARAAYKDTKKKKAEGK